MCGIVAYTGMRPAQDILLKGLKRLEYRGYDSAGIALLEKDNIQLFKVAGKVGDLENHLNGGASPSTIGIGHTRWATHGEPNDLNAHPHLSQKSDLAIIHNGIIENCYPLREELKARGHIFQSETDTEVLVHLIDEIRIKENLPFDEAVRLALHEVVGAYAIVVMSRSNPNTLVAARKGSPLVIGVGNEEYFLASDATPIIEYTRNVIYLDDNDVAVIRDNSMVIKTIDNEVQNHTIHELSISLEAIEKGGYEHFMLKEIFEQPTAIEDTLRGRVLPEKSFVNLGGVTEYADKFRNARRIIITACGTSWHAGLIGEYLIEEFARIPVEVEYASEFRYRNPIIHSDDVVVAISQSGETADTLAALDMAKKRGATIFGICNVVGASIPRMTDAGAYTHAGPEIGVASTKAFTTQVAVLSMLALQLAQIKGTMSRTRIAELLASLKAVPGQVVKALEYKNDIYQIAGEFKDSPNFLYLGRGVNFPIGLEGALKLKEISYIHAEGYPAAEMKHGPIALIDENMPVLVVATNKNHYDKVISNIQEVKARKGRVISIVNQGDGKIREMSDYVIEVPSNEELFMPIVSVIPLQLLSYYIAIMRECNVDQPRNLAKSVTVE